MFFKSVEQLVVVHFEFFFLKKDDSGGFGDLDTLSVETFGLTNKLHNFEVEVDVKFFVLLVTDDEGGLEGGFRTFNFVHPLLVVPHFVDSQLLTEGIITTVIFLNFSGIHDVFREQTDGTCDFLEQMSCPDYFSCLLGHVSYYRRGDFLVLEGSLNGVQFGCVVVQNSVIFSGKVVFQGVSFDC